MNLNANIFLAKIMQFIHDVMYVSTLKPGIKGKNLDKHFKTGVEFKVYLLTT